jgi:homotetrameric cytidine deaminase
LSTEIERRAFQAAKTARDRAYAAYSGFRVGAAVKAKNRDRIYAGCNVENASYGATICAERAAILSMVSDIGAAQLEFVVVVTDSDPVSVPCALCLQVIGEFAALDTPIHLASVDGIQTTYSLQELLPHPFVFDGPNSPPPA